MNSSIVVALLLIVVAVNAQWTDWVETPNSPCSDTCGYCGLRVFAERKCTVKQCLGPDQRFEECGAKLCSFPRNTCCGGYIKGLLPDRTFECVASADNLAARTKLA